jgi:hypothetical protein
MCCLPSGHRPLSLVFVIAAAAGLGAGCAKAGMGAEVRSDISARMASAENPIAACYAAAVQRNRKLRGLMTLSIVAEPKTGKFTGVVVDRDQVGDTGLRQCVVDEVSKLALAKPQTTRVQFQYPIDFQPVK